MSEYLTEWRIGPVPRLGAVPLQCWMADGSRRQVIRECGLLKFTDCTHPMQNAQAPEDAVRAWRVVKVRPMFAES